MQFGRRSFEAIRKLCERAPTRRWPARLDTMPKYVVSSTLESVGCHNATIFRGELVADVPGSRPGTRAVW